MFCWSVVFSLPCLFRIKLLSFFSSLSSAPRGQAGWQWRDDGEVFCWSVVCSLSFIFNKISTSFFTSLSSSSEGGRRVSYRGLRKLRPLAEAPFHPPGIPPKDTLRGTHFQEGTLCDAPNKENGYATIRTDADSCSGAGELPLILQ